jgi:hypothetical protein
LSTLALIQTALERGAQWPAELEEEQLRERHSTALTKVERRKMGGGGGAAEAWHGAACSIRCGAAEQRGSSAQQGSEHENRGNKEEPMTGGTFREREREGAWVASGPHRIFFFPDFR